MRVDLIARTHRSRLRELLAEPTKPVIITEGDFKGERGAIIDKHLIGDGLTVALEKHGKEIKTHEAHVNKVDAD